jgi:hypothetical protein
MTVYNPSIPQASDLISNSQSQILANFGQLNTQFGVDHSAFEAGGSNGTGFHKQVTFPAAVVAAPTGVVGIIHDVIAAMGSVSFATKPIPYFANSVGDFPIMPDINKGTGNDFSFQIGKLIVNCGFNTTSAGRTANIVFNQSYTANIIYIGLQAFTVPSIMTVSAQTNMGFTSNSNNPSVPFYYIAFGY